MSQCKMMKICSNWYGIGYGIGTQKYGLPILRMGKWYNPYHRSFFKYKIVWYAHTIGLYRSYGIGVHPPIYIGGVTHTAYTIGG